MALRSGFGCDRSLFGGLRSKSADLGRGGIGGRRGCRTGVVGSAVRFGGGKLTLLLGLGPVRLGPRFGWPVLARPAPVPRSWLAWDDCGSLSAHRLALKSWTLLGWQGSLLRLEVRPANGAMGCDSAAGDKLDRNCWGRFRRRQLDQGPVPGSVQLRLLAPRSGCFGTEGARDRFCSGRFSRDWCDHGDSAAGTDVGTATAGIVSVAGSSTRAGTKAGPTAVAGAEVAAVAGPRQPGSFLQRGVQP